MDPSENAEVQRTRNARRIALIFLVTLVVLVLLAVGIYVVAFVILSPMI
jgi:flagellar basal body-associated protein FliL